MTLRRYREKRNFHETPEPKGKKSQDSSAFLFVIQKHAASHLHYDFRLELQGVLKSWAVPKGPSLDARVKRLAIQVEDHPIDYGHFEGIIPQGQYGGGTVMLWDQGTWEPLDENPLAAYEKGHLRFILHAQKLHGRWDLIRFKDNNQWFLIKYQDKYVQQESEYSITADLDRSVISQLTIEELAANYQQVWDSKDAKLPQKSALLTAKFIRAHHLKPAPFPTSIAPQLATLVNNPPDAEDWLHEVKFDGYRILAFKHGDKVLLKSRNNKGWTKTFPIIANAVKSLAVERLILDGEVVAINKQGRFDFQLLQHSLTHETDTSLAYFIFDLLYLDQYDLRALPLIERKSILNNLLSNNHFPLMYSDHILKEGSSMFEQACNRSLEGIVSKRINSPYVSKRSKDWLKIKCIKRQEVIIGGYTSPQGTRQHFGALLLGVYNDKDELVYVGNVGTGFSDQALDEVYGLLKKYQKESNPFITKPPGFSKAHWVKPLIVCDIEFTDWTRDGRLRHPSFKGLRLDKKAKEVKREKEMSLAEVANKQETTKKAPKMLTNPEKILYPEDNITKQDLYDYYEAVSDYALPYYSLRPLTLLRCPSDYNQCFYQRHFNAATAKALNPIKIDNEEYIYLNDKAGLLSLVQMGVLEIHPWGSQIAHLEQPDIITFDLDPASNVPWSKVVESALEIREYLLQYQLTSFVKTTGGKGLHIVVPIKPEHDWEEVKNFTHSFVETLEKVKPKDYISKMTKSKRSGKIFIDYLRNQRTATAIGVYSTRARLHAPVSTPLAWDELSANIKDNTYTIKTLLTRLRHLKADPWKNFWSIKQSLKL